MYHQVPEYYRAVSERVSNILDAIGYSQEDRDRKVRYATGWEVFRNIYWTDEAAMRSYMFGSRGEGSTGPGLQSDHDILMYDGWKIITELSDFQQEKPNFLLVQDEWTHPGCVKLQRVMILPDNSPGPQFHYQDKIFRVESYDRTVISINRYHNVGSGYSVTGAAFHATSDFKEASIDYVHAIRCTQWPNEAHEWFQRRRPHQWPKADHMRNARKDYCFAAAVGHPHSHEQDLE